MDRLLDPFFHPRSIAIFGASANPEKIGGRPIRYLRMAGYRGRIVPINPERASVQDIPAFPSLAAVDGPIDLAIIAVPAAGVPAAVRQCVEHGVRAATIFSAGFAETGAEGERLQAEISAIAAGRLRLLGPNCMGVINTHTGTFATFSSSIVDSLPAKGRISLASQSGALGAHCLVLAQDRGLGINLWATTGNQVDVDIADFLAYMADDPETDVVLGCLEGVRNADRLIEAFRIARRNRKPVILLKVGRSEVGVLAAASHTASLAGSDAAFDAILRDNHVHRAASLEDLFDVAYACSFKRFPSNRRLGLLTFSGGGGILMADDAADVGLDVAPLPEAAQDRMKALLPFAGTRNPVDVTAQVINDPGLLEPMFDSLLRDGGYASAIAFFAHVGRAEAIMERLIPGLESVGRTNADSFLAISSLTTPAVRDRLEKAGFAVFDDPSRAVSAAAALARFRESFDSVDAEDPVAQASAPNAVLSAARGRTLSEHESRSLLRDAGLPVAPERLVRSGEAAAAAGREIGFPIVLKIVSPDIPHKSEIGGVILNVADEAAASQAFESLMQRGSAAVPAERIEGILVSPMVTGGVEMILGLTHDPVFGPMVMVGLGGVFVEVFKDIALAKAPLDARQARTLVRSLRAYPLLKGARGRPPADEDALVAAMVSLSRFGAAHAGIVESVDVNPLIVLAEGEGALALDALVTTLPETSAGHEAPR